MDTLFKQVRRAQRRLFAQRFLSNLMVCWFATLLAAVIAIGVTKFWAMPFAGDAWGYGWFAGALAVGAIGAFAWTWLQRRDTLATAVEIDRRYGLKERVSSSLALAPEDLESEAGRALLADALRRIGKLDVGDKFEIALSRRALLPLTTCVLALILVLFVGDKLPENVAAANTTANQYKTAAAVKESTESLRKKIEEIRKTAKDLGMQQTADLFKKVEDNIKDMNKSGEVDKKEVLVKLNDLAKQLEDRKQQIGGSDKIKQQLDQLKDLQKGPADKMAQAMKNGDFDKAAKELEKLKDEMEKGNLDDQKKQDLANQLEQMKDKLQQMANAREQAKQDLQQQIQQQRAAGNTDAAAQMQQQLDQLQQQTSKSDKQLQDMTQQLSQASQSMKKGDSAGAKDAMQNLSDSLSQLQKQQSELKTLESALDQIAQAKDQMNGKGACEKCQGGQGNDSSPGQGKGLGEGQGEGKGQGQGQGDKPGQSQGGQGGNGQQGDGLGLGRAEGATGQRPENANKTKTYDTKVNQNLRDGAALMTDLVDGPNVKGRVLERIKEQTESAKRETSDPLTNQRLPKQHKEHAQQYFDALRDGNKP